MFKNDLELRRQQGLFRKRQLIESAQGPIVRINNEEYINFSSNDYLGFADDKQLKERMIDAIKKYGIGSGSSQLLTGHSILHEKLEKKVAGFLKRESALVFSSGYQANLAIASVLIDAATTVIQDKLNHASLVDAALLSKGVLVRYAHNNVDHLSMLLEKYKQKKLIVMTDGVFSMDGDYAPLKEIASLCKKYNALLVVDDAHGIGVLGETGAGLLEEAGLTQNDVPLLIGTFGKSFGACGAFISGPEEIIECFVQKARTYIYTTALLPAVASTMTLAIDKIVNGQHLRTQIKKLVSRYAKNMQAKNYTVNAPGHIQPFHVGDTKKTLSLSNRLYEKKILANAIRPPTVPKGSARLRISITAKHTQQDVDRLVTALLESDMHE